MVNLVVLSNSKALAGSALGNAAAPVALAFATADIVATPMVKGLMADIMEDGKLFLARALLQGLPAVRQYLRTDSAKVCGYLETDVVNQATHEKFMKGEITTFDQLDESRFEIEKDPDLNSSESVSYIYIYQVVTNQYSKEKNYIINAIIMFEQ